jgi:hypothetical protein
MGARISQEELDKILTKKGYGLSGGLSSGGIKSTLGSGTLGSKGHDTGKDGDVEPNSGDEPLRSKSLSLNYTGKVLVRIKFYRRRLADYSRAISEKAWIDAIVASGALRDDTEKEIRLQDDGQEKVETNEEERMEITLEYEDFDFDNPFVQRQHFGNAGKKD